MNRSLLLLLALLAAGLARAQVDVKLSLDQEYFLPGETIEVAVRVSNYSGRKLTFGSNPGWLRFNVESADSYIVNRLSEIPDSGEFSLETATRGTIRYDVQPHFDLTRAGRYRLVATVMVSPQEQVVTTPVPFEIINGSRLWEREFGVAGTDPNLPPDRRKYLLQQANHTKEIRLYVRITDARELRTYKVVRIGGTVSFSKPEYLVDRNSRMHLLHQVNSDDYRYHIIDPNGNIERRQTYAFVDRRPQLRVNDEGEVGVIGGVRRQTSSDLPAEVPKDPPAPAAPKPDAPADPASK